MRMPLRLAPHTVTITPVTQGPFGTIEGDPVQVRCRIQMTQRQVVTSSAVDVIARGTLYGPPGAALGPVGSYCDIGTERYSVITYAEHYGRDGSVDVVSADIQ